MSENPNTDEIFNDLTAELEIDEHLENREELRARAAALRAEADALEARAEMLGKSDEELDCQILPEHFVPDAGKVLFLAPRSEREKMRSMLPDLRAKALRAGIILREMNESTDEHEDDEHGYDEDESEGLEQAVQEITNTGMLEVLQNTPGVSTLDVIDRTLYSDVMSLEETQAWSALFHGMLTTMEAPMRTIKKIVEITGQELPDDAFNDVRKNIEELQQLCERLRVITQTD